MRPPIVPENYAMTVMEDNEDVMRVLNNNFDSKVFNQPIDIFLTNQEANSTSEQSDHISDFTFNKSNFNEIPITSVLQLRNDHHLPMFRSVSANNLEKRNNIIQQDAI